MRATRGRLFPSFSLPSSSSLSFHAESQPVCQSFPTGLSLPINYSVSWPLKLPSPVRSSQHTAPKPHHLLNVLKRHHLERKSWVYYSCSEAQPSLSRTKGIETTYSEKMALQSKATYSSTSGTRSWDTSPASQLRNRSNDISGPNFPLPFTSFSSVNHRSNPNLSVISTCSLPSICLCFHIEVMHQQDG